MNSQSSQSVDDISSKLTCQCGCGLVLSNCNHENCPSAIPMRKSISQALKDGKSEEEIIDSFVKIYGEKVLAVPPKRGFNLTVWIIPFIVILVSGGIIYFAIRRWVEKDREEMDIKIKREITDTNKLKDYEDKIEKELKEFEK
jgi:cytochrome c-type biogenesis protein CcmH